MTMGNLAEEYRVALLAEVAEVHRLRELLWKNHFATCPAVQEPKPCDCGEALPDIETEWNNEVVHRVLSGERRIERIEMEAFGVGEQSITGGPVLRGPWGTAGGMQGDWARYDAECKRLNMAFLQGFLRGRFKSCQEHGECSARDGENYCMRCGATVVIDRRDRPT